MPPSPQSSSKGPEKDNFYYNSMLANALTQLLPFHERRIIRAWIEYLCNYNSGEISIKEDYMWFLLLLLQSKRITMPFCTMPPLELLLPLEEVVPKNIYEEVLKCASGPANLSWIDRMMSHQTVQPKLPKLTTTGSHPSKFLSNQPRPKSGIVCYMGTFSDQKN